MIVKNVNGTEDNTCQCGSWLNHWKRYSGQSLPVTCPVIGCKNKPEVGAHVQVSSATDNKWYIIPLCVMHNNTRGGSAAIGDVQLALANVSETCGKN